VTITRFPFPSTNDVLSAPLLFGSCEIRPAQRQLLVDGQPLTLGARAFDVLIALVERRERIVTKTELLDLAWPGLVVEENNLQVQISALRKALGASAISTVPGRGYQFTLAETRAAAAPVWSPPAAVYSASHALPQPASEMLGREAELAMLEQAIANERLLTVVGPGGMGKTRLAIEGAKRHAAAHPHGAAWVELAALGDAALIPGAIAAAIGLELQGTACLAALATALRPLSLLLVLDNAEHLLGQVAETAATLLRAAPGLRLLVTSQAPLRIDGEVVLRLDALGLPSPDATLAEAKCCPAFALLVDRARALDRRFVANEDNRAALIEICRRLDGLPLALQLAAARLPMLGAQGVARHLDERFKLLSAGKRDAAARHLSLQAVIDWSHALLEPEEQVAWRRLGMFEASFSLASAQAALADGGDEPWAAAERLASLVERSLVGVDTRDPPRYALSETGRAYARERSAQAGEIDALKACHAQIVRETFEAAPDAFLVSTDADWLARFEPELEDLRAALAWSILRDPVSAAAMVGAAAPLWRYLSLDDEARRWIDASEPAATAGALPAPIAARWWRAAQWAWSERDAQRSRAAGERAQALYRALDDAMGLYAELTAIAGQTDADTAQAALDEALALEQHDWPLRVRAWGWRARADVARAKQDWAASRDARARELALRRAAGDERGALRAELHLAELTLALGDAEAALAQASDLAERLGGGRSAMALCLALLLQARALLALGRDDDARALEPRLQSLASDCGLQARAAEVFEPPAPRR